MKRQSKNLASSLEHRLSGYALAASAAGVGVLALAQPAEGKIIYTPTHVRIGLNEKFQLDLNRDGIADFTLINSGYGGRSDYLEVGVPAYNFVWEQSKSQYHRQFAAAVRAGAHIGEGSNQFISSGPRFYMADVNDTGSGGPWKDVNKRYLGLKFDINGKYHYGWARLNVTIANQKVTGVLTGYAYETIPNKPIIAGRTHGPNVITVEPAGLGALAAGASGLRTWR